MILGLVVPLAMLSLAGRAWSPPAPTVQEAESDTLSPTRERPGWDEQIHLTVLTDNGNLRQMGMRDYLIGVVLAEMPADFESEALKAQAVVARTYTCKRMEHNKHGAAAVCTNSNCCQGYREWKDYLEAGGTEESVEKIRRAVMDTADQVLVYDGELIDATYFSCSGGSTEDAAAVWGRDVPYLQAVESPGEEEAPRYQVRISYTPENFRKMTGVSGEGSPNGWFGVPVYTDGGGVETLEICGTTFTGTELRSILGLRSTMFAITVEEGTIYVTTRGYGHRVGMSQYGAEAMAVSGSDYTEILRHYYTGTAIRVMIP